MTLAEQLTIMKQYAQMMLDRGDYHGLWDAAIDLQRLNDKLNNSSEGVKMVCKHHCHCNMAGGYSCCNCGLK